MGDRLRAFVKRAFWTLHVDVKRLDPSEPRKFVWLQRSGIRTVIDVGANTGQFAAWVHTLLPDATIYSFEPLRDCYETLIVAMKHVPRFRAFNVALGDTAEDKAVMYRNEFSPASSLLPLSGRATEFPHIAREFKEYTSVVRLDDVALDLDLNPEILLKVDVQGFEDRVIRGATKVLENTTTVIVEVSFQALYKGNPFFADIHDLLSQFGFHYAGSLNTMRSPQDGSIVQADALFLRNRPGSTA